eukprot:304207-Chlamydomonas_euryale.AAC.1
MTVSGAPRCLADVLAAHVCTRQKPASSISSSCCSRSVFRFRDSNIVIRHYKLGRNLGRNLGRAFRKLKSTRLYCCASACASACAGLPQDCVRTQSCASVGAS